MCPCATSAIGEQSTQKEGKDTSDGSQTHDIIGNQRKKIIG